MPRYGTLLLARELDGCDLAFDAALAEAARHEDRVDVVQTRGAFGLDALGLDVQNVHARARADARVAQRFGQRHVRIVEVDVLADHRDRDLGLGIRLGVDDGLPLRQIRRPRVELELIDDDAVEPLLVQQHRNLVDVVDVDRRDDGALLDVGEQRDLRALLARQRCCERHTSTSGWMPIERSSFTECCVGFVLISDDAAMNGTSVR